MRWRGPWRRRGCGKVADVCVTVPRSFGLQQWAGEGDAAGAEWSGQLWAFQTAGARPNIEPGERVYIVFNGRLRGYAPLVRLQASGGRVSLVRGGGAVAITIPDPIRGFRGWRYRWRDRGEEVPFPGWQEP